MPHAFVVAASLVVVVLTSFGCNRSPVPSPVRAPVPAAAPAPRLPESSVTYPGPTLGIPRDRVLSALIAMPGIAVAWSHGVPAARTRLPNVLVAATPDVCSVQIVGVPDDIESATVMIALIPGEAQEATSLRAACAIAFAEAFGISDSGARLARAIAAGETSTAVYGRMEARYSALASIGIASIVVRPAGAP